MYYLGTYYNGYCGCSEEVGIIADNMQDAEKYMAEGLGDYAEQYEHIAIEEWERQVETGETDEIENFYDSEAYENYYADCGYDIKECEADDSGNWTDIRE